MNNRTLFLRVCKIDIHDDVWNKAIKLKYKKSLVKSNGIFTLCHDRELCTLDLKVTKGVFY